MLITSSDNRQLQRKVGILCVAVLLFAALWVLPGCTSERQNYSRFYSISSKGWSANAPLHFAPDSLDSLGHYDVKVAIRHDTHYAYQKLLLAVDFIDAAGKVTRHMVDYDVADDYGNWKGAGFGSSYQLERTIARSVTRASVQRIVVWNGMKTREKLLQGVTDVGVTLTRCE